MSKVKRPKRQHHYPTTPHGGPDLLDPENAAKLFFAGGVSGALARACGSPFARIAIMLQTQSLYTDAEGMKTPGAVHRPAQWSSMVDIARTIWNRDGFKGFFRGNGVDVIRGIPATGIGYLSYEFYKKKIRIHYPEHHSQLYDWIVRLTAGGLAGLTATIATYPLDLLRTRMCVSNRYTGSIPSMFREIVRTEGLWSLYRGAGVACLGVVPNLAVNFAVFECTRNYLESKYGHHPPTSLDHVAHEPRLWMSLVSGVWSGLISTVVTFPIDLVQRRMMVQGMRGHARVYTRMRCMSQCNSHNHEREGVWDCVRTVVRNEGWMGMYSGLLPQALRSLPVCAISFAAYDQLRTWWLHFDSD